MNELTDHLCFVIRRRVISVLSQKKIYTFCHSGLDPESSVFNLDSRFRGNDTSHHYCKEVLETLH